MKITCVLIDDEPKAIAILKNKLERLCPEIDIIGESQKPEEAFVLDQQTTRGAHNKQQGLPSIPALAPVVKSR